jgi:cupin 2 domain-containing protein
MDKGNLFIDAGPPTQGESFTPLLAHKNLLIERIVSSAKSQPVDYVQTQDEWVVLLQGEAVLQVSGESISLASGDHVFLPAGTPHKVARVSEGAMWLAVHLQNPELTPSA